MKCRFCSCSAQETFVDLGMQPLSNAYVPPEAEDAMEPFYPLHARVCESCFLVQVPELRSPESIFSEYAYLSSVSESWLAHCREYASSAIERFHLGASSLVVEVASNDGYLLRYFRERAIPVLGIEPAANIAAIANAAGIPTLARFFGTPLANELAKTGRRADLLVGNNVLAHVPDLNDFVQGLRTMLAPSGVLTMEFPHLLRLIEHNQFDTIYHEHFSYFSFTTVKKVFEAHGITLFDVLELPTHGGSLRIHGCLAEAKRAPTPSVAALLATEDALGLLGMEVYRHFGEKVRETKRKFLDFLIAQRRRGKHIAAYGAAAKGNTLLNFCGVRTDFIDYVADRNPMKQGKLLPGTRIPVTAPARIAETKPDYVVILPWNIRAEVASQLAFVKEWGGQLVVPIPEAVVLQ